MAGIVLTKMPMIAIAGNRSLRTKDMMPAPTPHTAETAVAMTIPPTTAPLPVSWVAMTIANATPPIGQSSEVKPNTGDALTRNGSLDAKRSSVAVPRLRVRAEVILFLSRGTPLFSLQAEHFWPWQRRHQRAVAGWCSRAAHSASLHGFIASVNAVPCLRIPAHVSTSSGWGLRWNDSPQVRLNTANCS